MDYSNKFQKPIEYKSINTSSTKKIRVSNNECGKTCNKKVCFCGKV